MSVAAIIPTYLRHDLLLNRSLASVLRQTVPVDEIIIIVDGEPMRSFVDLCRELPQDARIEVMNIERPVYPQWPGDMWLVQGWKARNTGLDTATSEYVAPLDDDDEWTDDHIEILMNAINSTGADFAYGKAITPQGQWYGHWPPSGANFTDGSQLYRRDLGYRYDPECITRGKAEDQDLWDRMVEGGVHFTFVEHLVHNYFPANR